MRHSVWLFAVAALVFAGCRTSPTGDGSATIDPGFSCSDPILKLDRGDWMVNQGSQVWKVMAASAANRPPRHIGYVFGRQYRQMRGGPEFQVQTVTTLDRHEQIGHIDQLGKGVRYEPRRNGSFREVSVGTNTRELNVGAIFGTNDRITLERTSERRLAFEALDANGDGVLQPAETASFGDRIAGADTNRDGIVDFEEFDAVDVL
jgi:hypothetical protein